MSEAAALSGQVLAGKYRVERMLGEGGHGIVVAALHLTLGERVAIKLLRPEVADEETVARFLREGRAAVRIKGEHVSVTGDPETLSTDRETSFRATHPSGSRTSPSRPPQRPPRQRSLDHPPDARGQAPRDLTPNARHQARGLPAQERVRRPRRIMVAQLARAGLDRAGAPACALDGRPAGHAKSKCPNDRGRPTVDSVTGAYARLAACAVHSSLA